MDLLILYCTFNRHTQQHHYNHNDNPLVSVVTPFNELFIKPTVMLCLLNKCFYGSSSSLHPDAFLLHLWLTGFCCWWRTCILWRCALLLNSVESQTSTLFQWITSPINCCCGHKHCSVLIPGLFDFSVCNTARVITQKRMPFNSASSYTFFHAPPQGFFSSTLLHLSSHITDLIANEMLLCDTVCMKINSHWNRTGIVIDNVSLKPLSVKDSRLRWHWWIRLTKLYRDGLKYLSSPILKDC